MNAAQRSIAIREQRALATLRGDCEYGTVVALLEKAASKAISDRCEQIAGDA